MLKKQVEKNVNKTAVVGRALYVVLDTILRHRFDAVLLDGLKSVFKFSFCPSTGYFTLVNFRIEFLFCNIIFSQSCCKIRISQ